MNKWFELELPLEDMKKRRTAGGKIVDITIWVWGGKKGVVLPKDAAFYLDKIVLRSK